MAKRKITDARQLTLFDRGLEAPSGMGSPPPDLHPGFVADLQPIEAEAFPPQPSSTPEPLQEVQSQELEPTLFEKANYDLYVKRREEAGSLTRQSALLLVLLLFVAVLRIRPQEAFFIVKFNALPLAYVAGALGWATFVYTCYALQTAAQAALKKRQCGPFYQRVLRFSDSRAARWISAFLTVLYAACMFGMIAITCIVAGPEMLALAKDILIGILNMFRIGPWDTVGP